MKKVYLAHPISTKAEFNDSRAILSEEKVIEIRSRDFGDLTHEERGAEMKVALSSQ